MPNKKILIGEDEKPMAKALELKLKSAGFDVKVAYNGEEILNLLKSEKFDLLFLDLVMPKIDGFGVFQAKNGQEGLEIAFKEHPDIILLDIIMPKMNGVKMLKELRKDTWGSKVQVIVLTVLNDREKIAEMLESGAYDYLIKSDWKLEDVVNKVKEKLKV